MSRHLHSNQPSKMMRIVRDSTSLTKKLNSTLMMLLIVDLQPKRIRRERTLTFLDILIKKRLKIKRLNLSKHLRVYSMVVTEKYRKAKSKTETKALPNRSKEFLNSKLGHRRLRIHINSSTWILTRSPVLAKIPSNRKISKLL